MPPGDDVLTAALAAGLAIPYSCRAGRCASCKSKLVSGLIEYPAEFGGGAPPGITAAEIAQGEVLLCQARPRSDLRVEVRRAPVRASNAAQAELVKVERLSFGALRLTLRFIDVSIGATPGKFVDVRNHAGDAERLPVVGASPGVLEVESPDDGGALHQWLAEYTATSVAPRLRISGPFDRPR